MATPPIPPRPVSYVSYAADGEDQINDDKRSTERHDKPIPAKKPVAAKKPSLPAAKSVEDSPPPKPLRKLRSVAEQQSDNATVTGAPPKPARPRSTHEPDKSAVPPRPTRPPGIKPPAHKPAAVAAKATPSKPSGEPVATRPMITVISAKPMGSDTIPPPEPSDDVKVKEKPSKPTKPARPPQKKPKDEDNVPADTVEDLKCSAKQSPSLERPVVKKRASLEKVPENAIKKEDEETKTSPVPVKRKKSNVKIPSPEPAPTTKVKEGKKPPPPRPSYSIDDAIKHKSSSEEPPPHTESDDQSPLKPVARSRTLSASKVRKPAPPKPSQPVISKAAHNVPDEVSEPTKPPISKRMSLPRTEIVADQDVPNLDKSDSKEATEKLPTTRPRTHSGGAKQRPPKPMPPKFPPPKPAPPKSAPKNSEPENLAGDKHKQEDVPAENQSHSGIKHPPKPAPPKPALFKSHKPASDKDKEKDSIEDKSSENLHRTVSADNDESMVTASDHSSAQGEGTIPQESERPPISKRSSSRKWKPAVTQKQDVPTIDKTVDMKLSSETTIETQEEASSNVDQPPPRPLPPKDDFESGEEPSTNKIIVQEEKDQPPTVQLKPVPSSKKPVDQAVEKKLPTQTQKPSPPQAKKPLPPQVTKPLPPQANKPSPLQVKKPPPSQVERTEHNETLDNQSIPVKQEASDLPSVEEHKKLPPPKPIPSEKLQKLNVEDQLSSRSTAGEAEKEKDNSLDSKQSIEHMSKEHIDPPVPKQKQKPPRPTMPSAPPLRKTPEPESHPVDEPPPLPKRPTPGHPLYHYVTTKPRGTARFDYNPEDKEELSFLKDNLIELIERVDENWFYGCNVDNDCKEGMVLEKYIKIIKRLPGEDKLSYLKELPSAVAMFDFDGENEDELSFVAGDLIILEEKIDDIWLKGYTRSPQESGIFPAEFVEVVEPLPPTSESVSNKSQVQPSVTTDHSSNPASSLGDKPYCIVESQFISEGSDELSIEPGDIVILLEKVNEDWLKGTLNLKTGIFPSAFVDVKVPLPTLSKQPAKEAATSPAEDATTSPAEDSTTSLAKDTTSLTEMKSITEKPVGKCKVLYEFLAEQEGEMSLNVGDTVITTAWVNDEWLQGTCSGKEGMFPIQFVQIVVDLPKDSTIVSDKMPKNISAETDLSPRAKAVKDHIASDNDELNFKVGDVIYLLDKIDGGKFLEGELNNKVGKFPSSYVEVIVALP